jgi:hypothetical protein
MSNTGVSAKEFGPVSEVMHVTGTAFSKNCFHHEREAKFTKKKNHTSAHLIDCHFIYRYANHEYRDC